MDRSVRPGCALSGWAFPGWAFPRRTRRGRLRRTAPMLLAAPLLATVVLTGCGGSGAGSRTSAGGASDVGALGNTGNVGDASARAPELADSAKSAGGDAAGSGVQQRAVISTGRIALRSTDLTATRTRLDTVLAREHGRVADENTATDDDGTVTSAHLVLRVPGHRFDDAMTSLAGIATLRSASRRSDDVTTRVIDLEARIAAERAGVRRLRHLVSQTADLRALLDVERALTERQGELESLQQQRTYLHDQTTYATITVDITRHTTPAPAVHAAGGFVGGLTHGWDALVAVVTALLVALGALLPFTVALAVLGLPAWIVVRRLRRDRRIEEPAES